MQRNSIYNVVLTGPAFLLLGSFVLSNPAHAGFKWVEPSQAPQAPSVEVALPQAQVITGQSAASSVVTGDVQVIMAPESMAIRTPAATISTGAPAVNVVQGFADDVPLSVALRQILPRDVGFSVAQDVSLGTLVSWKGGAPWRTVLKTMLASKKLTIKEEGGLVHVVHQDAKLQPSYLAPPKSVMKSEPVALTPKVKPVPVYMPHPKVSSKPKMKALGYLPVATAAEPTPNHVNQAWVAHKGQMLRAVLMDWGRRANVDVSWQAEYDYPFQASVSVMGTFEEAARKLLSGFQEADPKPVGYLYNNQNAGQRVLVVQTR